MFCELVVIEITSIEDSGWMLLNYLDSQKCARCQVTVDFVTRLFLINPYYYIEYHPTFIYFYIAQRNCHDPIFCIPA